MGKAEYCNCALDDVLSTLDRLTHDTELMTETAFQAFLKHSWRKVDETNRLGEKVENEAKQLMQDIISGSKQSNSLKSTDVIEIATEMINIKHYIDKILVSVRDKIYEGVLFSDKAVLELKDFFNAAIDGLKQVHDLVLVKNPLLVKHILKTYENYDTIGRKYAEEHEERLIKGICLPKSSLIYLLILESLKDILRSIRAISLLFNENEKK